MSATEGYGYVDRQVDSQIDWSAVASGFTDTLQAEIAGRQAKKDELDKAARDMQERLANAPSGTYTEANEFAAQFAADGSAAMLAANRALKAGLLQPRQYSLIAANLNDSTDKVYGMAKKYEEVYKLKMERKKNGESQEYEGWEMDQIGGLYNIQNTKALINQNNGMVSIGHWEDGKMDGDPNQFMTVNQMTAALNSQYDNFDLQKAIVDDKSRLGIIDSLKMQYGGEGDLEYLIKTRSQGGKYSKDAEEIKLYEEWREETTKRFMVNEWDVVSVLTDEGLTVNGKAYTFSKDPADKNKEGIIFINTEKSARGNPELTDAQKKAAEEHIKGQIDASINKEITTQTSRRGKDTATDIALDREKSSAENKFNMLSDLYYGDDAAVDAAETFFRDNIQNAIKVDKRGDVIVVTFRNDDGTTSTRDVPLVDANGNLMGFETFAQSSTLLTGIDNIADSVDLGGGVQQGKVKSVISDEDKENGIVIEFENGRKEKITLGEKEKLTDKKYQDLVGQTIEFRSVSQGTDGGAQVFQDETIEAQGKRYYDKEITSDLFFGKNDDATFADLQRILSPFGFKVTLSNNPFGSNIGVQKGDEPKEFFNSNQDTQEQATEVMNRLLSYVKTNTSAAEYDGLREFLDSEVGRITGEDLAAKDRKRKKALDTSKYNNPEDE